MVHNYSGSFLDEPPYRLGHSVPNGPFGYLITSEERVAELRKLRKDLLTTYKPGDGIVSLYSFTAPYLFLPTEPAAHQTF